MPKAQKKEPSKTLKAGGAPHKVYKKKGKVIVDHLDKKGGKWDKIDLTKMAGAKSVKAGVKATKDWHKTNPHKKDKKSK
jgi:hypothetical protein